MPADDQPVGQRPGLGRHGLTLLLPLLVLAALSLAPAAPAAAQNAETISPLRPIDNSSPRDTLRSFLDGTDRMIRAWREGGDSPELHDVRHAIVETLDLSTTAHGDSWSERSNRILLLREILDRIPLPPFDEIPGDAEVAERGITEWTIPDTRITIARLDAGPQAGEFVFAAASVERLDSFYREVRQLPYKPGAPPGIYEDYLRSDRTLRARTAEIRNRLRGLDTNSPRFTLDGFLDSVNGARRLITEAEAALQATPPAMTRAEVRAIELRADNLLQRAMGALDLSEVPEAHRRDRALEAVLQLKEILDRVVLPPIESVPDASMVAAQRRQLAGAAGPFRWRVPDTEIEIVEMTEGPRAGAFLFSAATVERIDDFYAELRDLPYRDPRITSNVLIEYSAAQTSAGFYEDYISTPGYLVPGATFLGRLIDGLPDGLKLLYGGQTAWQWIGLLLCLLLAVAAGYLTFRLFAQAARRLASPLRYWVKTLAPLIVAGLLLVFEDFISTDLNVTGDVHTAVTALIEGAVLLLVAWAVMKLLNALAETAIASPRIADRSIDASLLRILAQLLGVVAGVWIVVDGLQDLGADVIPLLAGLGVGGLAVALAVRPTLENLIGGLILYFDKPVRVGDFCSFGDRRGVIEEIGLRSTQIRAPDRSLISVPNANFCDMEIVNWTRCDRHMIRAVIGLRYETGGARLRALLAALREMLAAQPQIERDTIRVRFAGYGASSLDVEIRVYALTGDWEDFLAIREEVLLRIEDAVRQAGCDFALPARRIYRGRDAKTSDIVQAPTV